MNNKRRDMLRIAIAQINVTVGDLGGNRKKIISCIRRAKRDEADIVAFPELAITGYPPEDLLHKEYFVRDNIKALHFLAKKVPKITAIVGFVDMDKKKRLYNAAAIIYDGCIKGIYHKKELPNYGVFDEKRYFVSGDNNLLFSLRKIPFSVNICEDIWLRDGVHRTQAKRGAKVIINISASPYHIGKLEQREKLFATIAHQNKAFVCYANLVGGQDELVFDGVSLIIDPYGQIITSGKQFEEDFIAADLNVNFTKKLKSIQKVIFIPSSIGYVKKKSINQQVAPRLGQIEKIYKALILGTRDYVQKNGFKKVVIGLSGGIDSSLVAVIAREALGKDRVIGVSMPSQYSSSATKADAKKTAKNLGIRFIEIPIKEVFHSYLIVLRKEFANQKVDITEENLQARIRGNLLMALSNKFGWLVLTTGNKSEIAMGYCTLYGDLSGGFAVIKDVPKTMVYELAKFVNVQKFKLIPNSVLTRAPTAELKKGQKDEDSLPPYEVLDPILKAYVEQHRSLAQMKKVNKDAKLVKKVIKMVDLSEYKRRQSPPGIKITPRAFGKDWRLPITSRYKEF